jgi:outer membrane protein
MIKYIAIGLMLFINTMVNAQSEKNSNSEKLSLVQAIDYALKNNAELVKANIDVDISKETVKQTVAIGLPQISTSAAYQHYLTVPGQWIKNFAYQPGSPEYIFLQFQQKVNSTANISVNQLLFDGSYLVGLKATKEFLNMSKFVKNQTEAQLISNVTKSYLAVVSTELNIELLESNIETVKKSLHDVTAMYEEGFTEDLDVKRLKLSLSNLEVEKQKLDNAVLFLKNSLKVQIGMPVSRKIELTDKIETVDEKITLMEADNMEKFDASMRPEYSILDQAIRLGKLDKQRYQTGFLPRLVGFYQHQEMTMRPEFNFFESNLTPNNNWVPSDVVGLQIQWTLFDGLSTASKIREVQYKIDQAQIDLDNFKNAASMQYNNAIQTYKVRVEQAKIQKSNLNLANEIHEKTLLKLKEGVGSTLEISQAESELKAAQINYINALYDLVIAKIDYYNSIGKKIK